jgi:hypothetical protein
MWKALRLRYDNPRGLPPIAWKIWSTWLSPFVPLPSPSIMGQQRIGGFIAGRGIGSAKRTARPYRQVVQPP